VSFPHLSLRIFLCLLFFCAPLHAQEGQVPHFFSPHERLERPDLGQLPRLRFLTTVDFPPFNYLDGSNNLAGYHIDLARALCLELKLAVRCQIEAVEWDQLPEKLQRGEAEAIIAGLAVTAQRRADFAFSRPYMRFPARFVTSSDSRDFSLSLQQTKIGLVSNTAHEKIFTAYFPTLQPQFFDDYQTLTRALRDKEIELAFGDGMYFSRWLSAQDSQNCCHFIGDAYYGEALGQGLRLAVSSQHKSLVKAFDYALAALEKRGKLTELYLRYFPIGFY